MYEFAVTPAVTQLRKRGVEITEVALGSIAAEMELEPGDRVIRVNGQLVRDYLDFRFQTGGEESFVLDVRRKSGEYWELQIDRDEGEELGLGFEQIVPRQCANECIFCFCKGNPESARKSLFVRDEDVRLSFLYGNYTTLTSVTEDEMTRIISQRLTPQYVSIHATDLKVRAYLLGVDERRADISKNLNRLLDAGIEIHAQVVLCPGINDGPILIRTIEDLAAHFPRITSVAVVPLALTLHNTDERLTRATPSWCAEVVSVMTDVQQSLFNRLGTNFAFLGDEIYLRAGARIPARKHYGDYPQIEDGVGMVRTFTDEFARLLKRLKKSPPAAAAIANCRATVLTGELFAPHLKLALDQANAGLGTGLEVVAVRNRYFGGDVSVAGLLTGADLLAAKAQIRSDHVLIPSATLKSDEPIMLDGMTLTEFQQAIARPVHAVDFGGLARIISGVDQL
jgi:putative radical SAM enzyme (TIGR03279 family)